MDLPLAIFVLSVAVLVTVAAIITFIAGKLHQMNKSHARIIQAVETMQTLVHALNTRSAVNESGYKDMSTHLAEQAKQLCDQDEAIHQLRTAVHMHANELIKMDPAFTPYRRSVVSEDKTRQVR